MADMNAASPLGAWVRSVCSLVNEAAVSRKVVWRHCPYTVAPGSDQVWANNKILVHDFTHRLHMEIFNQQYYPEELPDWWMDDWMTFVYVDPSCLP